jgi:hypothetical protein
MMRPNEAWNCIVLHLLGPCACPHDGDDALCYYISIGDMHAVTMHDALTAPCFRAQS